MFTRDDIQFVLSVLKAKPKKYEADHRMIRKFEQILGVMDRTPFDEYAIVSSSKDGDYSIVSRHSADMLLISELIENCYLLGGRPGHDMRLSTQ